jgi:hypothetical protein
VIAEKMRKLGLNVIDPVLCIRYEPSEKDLECKLPGKGYRIK